MKHPDPLRMADEIGKDAADLIRLLEDATAVQYERSRRPGEADSEKIRAKGAVSRPTEETALDPVRLALREEVKRSASLLIRTHRDLHLAAGRLALAMEAWRGE